MSSVNVNVGMTLPYKGDGEEVIAKMWRVFYELAAEESDTVDRAIWIRGDEPASVAINAAGPSDGPSFPRFIVRNAVAGLDSLFHAIDAEASDSKEKFAALDSEYFEWMKDLILAVWNSPATQTLHLESRLDPLGIYGTLNRFVNLDDASALVWLCGTKMQELSSTPRPKKVVKRKPPRQRRKS